MLNIQTIDWIQFLFIGCGSLAAFVILIWTAIYLGMRCTTAFPPKHGKLVFYEPEEEEGDEEE